MEIFGWIILGLVIVVVGFAAWFFLYGMNVG